MSIRDDPLLIKEGHLDKEHPHTGYFNKRLVRLTGLNLQWYEPEIDPEMGVGLQRGVVSLAAVRSSTSVPDDPCLIQISIVDRDPIVFRASSKGIVREWLYALDLAVRSSRGERRMCSGVSAVEDDADPLTVSAVRVGGACATSDNTKSVVSSPKWGRPIDLCMSAGDAVEVIMSNGAACSVAYADICSLIAASSLPDHAEVSVEWTLVIAGPPQSLGVTLAPLLTHRPTPSSYSAASIWKLLSSSSSIINPSPTIIAISCLVALICIHSFVSLTACLIILSSILITLVPIILHYPSIYQSIYRSISPSISSSISSSSSIHFRLIPTHHDYTSPFLSVPSLSPLSLTPLSRDSDDDEPPPPSPPSDVAEDPPARFLNGCSGDLAEARRRWRTTMKWRRDEEVDSVLSERQPMFGAIRAHMAFYHAGTGVDGHSVYYVRPPNDADHREMMRLGVSMRDLWRCWLFVTEYRWRELMVDELDRSVTVIDIENIALSDVAGSKLDFLRKTVLAANAHYPERSHAILIVNAPFWFSVIWKLVQPLINEKTLHRTRILSKSETLRGMQDFIDVDQIPVFYGGKLSYGDGVDSCRYNSPEAVALDMFVAKVNESSIGSKEGEGGGRRLSMQQ